MTKILFYRESLLQSCISDLITFGFTMVCIYISYGSIIWEIITVILFIVFFILRIIPNKNNTKIFYNKHSIIDYINKNIKE